MDTNGGAPNEKKGDNGRLDCQLLTLNRRRALPLRKSSAGFATKTKSKDNGAEVSDLRKWDGGGVLVELKRKHGTFCQASTDY